MIYFCDSHPFAAAVALDDRRLIQALDDTAILMNDSMVLRGLDPVLKPTEGPASIELLWASSYLGNWWWLYRYFQKLNKEYSFRFMKFSGYRNLMPIFTQQSRYIRSFSIRHRPFPNLTPFRFKRTAIAYRALLIEEWRTEQPHPHWSRRGLPIW